MSDLTLVLGPHWARFSKKITVGTSDDYDFAAADQLPKLLEFEEASIDGIQDLFGILSELRQQRNVCVVRGALLPGQEQPCRRLLIPRTEDGVDCPATMQDMPRRWLMVDFDSVNEPDGERHPFCMDPAHAAAYLRSSLPVEFREAACVWRASGSAGFKPGIRLHLWFLLDRALLGDECKAWLSHGLLPVDRTVYGAVQPHYTADPLLGDGVIDPMVERIGLLPGAELVAVPATIPEDKVKSAKAPKTSARGVVDARSADGRPLDPFVRAGLSKWDAEHPWDGGEPDLSERFQCPACGSSDGCAMLPDGKLFCHGGKHPHEAPDIGHAANNGYVMHRFEAFERVQWKDVPRRLQELGYMPGLPTTSKPKLTAAEAEDVDAAADAMGAVVEGRTDGDVDVSKIKRAKKDLKSLIEDIRIDPDRTEELVFEFARRYVPRAYTIAGVREALIRGDGKTAGPRAQLYDAKIEQAIERGLERGAAADLPDVVHALSVDAYGKPERCLANIVKLLTLPEFTDVLAFDVRARRVVVTDAPPWFAEGTKSTYPYPFDTDDATALTAYLADMHKYPWSDIRQVLQAATFSAQGREIDPVLDYLEALPPFDGDLDDARTVAGCWLTEFAGAPDDEYTRAVAMRWLISAVARTYEPGCKVREVLTLLGPQNIGKSLILQTICGKRWFKDDLNLDRAPQQALLGKFIVELSEIDRIVATDRHGTIKAFLSTEVDDYLPPYGHLPVSVPRRSVFAATGNPLQIFRDPTGNTRFNVVVLERDVDVAGVHDARDELWAAARMLYKAGEPWYLQTDEKREAMARQAVHRELDDVEVLLGDLVETPVRNPLPGFESRQYSAPNEGARTLMWVTTVQLMHFLQTHGQARNINRRIVDAMKTLGWSKVRHADGSRLGGAGWRR